MADIFNNDAFSVMNLTDAVNKLPYIPGRAGALNLFEESGVSTTSIAIEERDGTLELVPTTQRGAPGTPNTGDKRKMRTLRIPHICLTDFIPADEVQNVRQFGSDNALAGVQQVVGDRMSGMASKIDATIEHMRLGAIKGVILNSNGTDTIYDLFSEFGVTQYDEIDFDLDAASPKSGDVRKKCADVQRKVEDVLGAAVYDHIHAFCSSQFFDDLVDHPEVRKAYELQNQGAYLIAGHARRSVSYAGIVFEEYRGTVNGVKFIADNKAHFFPVGVPGLFKTVFAPADYVETVNTLGLPRYAKQAPDTKFGKFVELEVQANPLTYCTRPKVLIKAKRT
ncbi:MAG TPA: major capsid protein E [Rhodospirillaceae bacterium]|nr:MAG: hypothetical protein A2018_05610 [Alphaproteobacteria bacterium GWF2_58_20]HAU28991.1 major capsid protein E [Rhodospirillaceae bacterium]